MSVYEDLKAGSVIKREREAYAKINLFLDVTGRRKDGFHDIISVMHSVSLSDTVSLKAAISNEKKVILSIRGAYLPVDNRNLAYRAAEEFMTVAGLSLNASIEINKRIPVAAGLGGGSSDAAAVLHLLNEITGHPFDTSALCSLGAKIGSDVPFCILGGSAFCTGRGEIMTPYFNIPALHFIVAIGREKTSTAQAYSSLDKKYFPVGSESGGHAEEKFDSICRGIENGNVMEIAGGVYNIFEDVMAIESPKAMRIIRELRARGALAAAMSGSGPSVFGIFDSEEKAKAAVKGLYGRAFAVESAQGQG